MTKILMKAAATMLATVSVQAASATNLLVNASFEARVVTAADSCSSAPWCVRSAASTPGWTQILDGVDLIHNNYTQGPAVLVDAAEGVNFIDMNQTGSLGGLEQVVTATVGQVFNLSLQTTAWATNSIGGTIGYELYNPTTLAILASGSYQDNIGGTWITRTLSATATSTSIGVRIKGITATQAGMGLDNVTLTATPVPGAVPEPATWMMMILGFGAIGGAMRSRTKAQVRFS